MRSSIKGMAPEWYTLESERDQPDPAMFLIHPLDGFGWTEVMGASFDPESGSVGLAGIRRAFQLAVKDWRNIEDADHPGQALPFSRRAMGRIAPADLIEVGSRVLEVSQLDEARAKNSGSPSSFPATEPSSNALAGDAIVPTDDGEASHG